MASILLAALPIAYVMYLRSNYDNLRGNPQTAVDASKDSFWPHDNLNLYIDEGPLLPVQFFPGDQYEYSLKNPLGTISDQVRSLEGSPQEQLMTIANWSRTKDQYIMGLSSEFMKPRQEIQTRSVDQHRTLVSLYPGDYFDEHVKTGVRYWDRPVPRSTGIDRYYPSYYSVPFVYRP